MSFLISHKPHEAIFEETTVHFIFTWAAVRPLDVQQFASRLLSADIAETVGSSAADEVRVSPRLASVGTDIRRLRRLEELYQFDSRLDMAKWILRNPRLAAKLLRITRRHMPPQPSDDPPSGAKLTEVAEELKKSIASAQAVNAIQLEIERGLYSPTYLSTEPYLRLTLRGLPCWLDITDHGLPRKPGDSSNGVLAEVLLLIHRSGSIQLTIVLRLPNALPTDSLVPLTLASNVRIARSETAESIIRASARHIRAPENLWIGQWADGKARGTRWRQIEHAPAITLVDVFTMYRDAIEEAAHVRFFDDWLCYPVVFLESLGCCSSEREWRRRHDDAFTRVIVRTPKLPLRRSLIPPDQALTTEFSVYYCEGSATHFNWGFASGRSEFADQLQIVVLVEHVLLRYWQLVALAERLASVRVDYRSAASVQREAIFGLQEYRRPVLVFGTARDIADELLSLLRERQLYQRILESLALLQQMTATENAKRSSRTQNMVAVAAILAALVLGLPTVQASLTIVKSVPHAGVLGRMANPLRDLASRGAIGVWESYLSLLAIVVLTVATSLALRRPRARARRQSVPGVAWPYGTVRVVRRDAGDDSDGALPETSARTDAAGDAGTP
jgi:hypothetical protein